MDAETDAGSIEALLVMRAFNQGHGYSRLFDVLCFAGSVGFARARAI